MLLTLRSPGWTSSIFTDALCPNFVVKVYSHSFVGSPVLFWDFLREYTYTNTHTGFTFIEK